MSPLTNTRVLFNDYPTGYPEPGKTVVVDTSESIDIDSASLNGGVLVKVLNVSIDPYLRGKMNKQATYHTGFEIGKPIVAHGITKVIRSDSSKFVVGDHLYGVTPFSEYAILNDLDNFAKIENSENLPWSVFIGVCGMPGKTAFYGYKEYIQPFANKGDTIFITTGAGPVGSLLIQLAKGDGLKVVASAGSEEKVQFMKECGADVTFNYKTTSTKEVLKEHGPINFYWDHVGGEILDHALEASAPFSHFVECGLISGYNGQGQPIKNYAHILFKSITVHGHLVFNLEKKYSALFLQTVPQLVAKGTFKYKEDIRRGLESVGQTILDVQTGNNTGKAVVILADE